MKVQDICADEALANLKKLLSEDKTLSPALRAAIEVIMLLVALLIDRLGLNSKNSSKPPSSDFGSSTPSETNEKKKSARKQGGQNGHIGSTLTKIDNPDQTFNLSVDLNALSKVGTYTSVGFETRQVFNIIIKRHVIEYRAEILENEKGERFTAKFPDNVLLPTQYASELKAHAVYLSQGQMLPYQRLKDYFHSSAGIPLSPGSLYNFNLKAYKLLGEFEGFAKAKLIEAMQLNADETSIRVGGKRIWLHCASNKHWTFLYPHERSGKEAMEEMDVLPHFKGVLSHDHWKAYFAFLCVHSLCNAHHLRELTRAWEHDNQTWAKKMHALLIEMNKQVKEAGGEFSETQAKPLIKRYRTLLTQGEKECPLITERPDGKRGKIAQSKSRNLLSRLRHFEAETLLFLTNKHVPFTNNQGENDIRMTKVQQKISGCFRSMKGAKIFCRIRSFLITCQKHGVNTVEALEGLFEGRLPDFVNN